MKIPVLLFASAALAFSQPVVKNPSFETPDNGGCPEFKYRPYSAPWEFVSAYSGISAIGCNVRFVSPPQPAGLGRQAAFLQSLGEPASIRQTVTGFVPGRTYVMSFFAAGRRNNPQDCNRGCGKLNLSVFIGSDKVLDVEPSTEAFQQYTTRSFTTSQPNQTVTFSGQAPAGADQTSFIDLVVISDAVGAPQVVPSASATLTSAPATLTSAPASAAAPLQPPPPHLMECESSDRCDGFWTFNGTRGWAVWQSGARAKLSVVSFDSRNIVIERTDSDGSSPGLTAVYRGVLTGKRFEGDVTWTWPGHWAGPGRGHWSATVDDAASAPNAGTPAFLKDAAFTFDFTGEWRLNFPPESPRKPLITLVARQDANGAIQFIAGNPNILWPFGQCMFNGVYEDGRISGDIIETPAHAGSGFGGWAWGPTEIKVVDANTLILPTNIVMKRTTVQLGANVICDPVADARAGNASDQLIYANRDYDLKNFANAACWYYTSAAQGNADAQFGLAIALVKGDGVIKNKAQAFFWFKKAAEQGYLDALHAVARSYEVGMGVEKDPALAKAWADRYATQSERLRQAQAAEQQSRANIAAWSILLGGGNSAFDDQVERNQSRGMSHSDAVDAARSSQAEADFWNSLTHYEPPAPPKKQP
jgi:hypothetical protein